MPIILWKGITCFMEVCDSFVIKKRDMVKGRSASWNSTTCIAPNSKDGVRTFQKYMLAPRGTLLEMYNTTKPLATKKKLKTTRVARVIKIGKEQTEREQFKTHSTHTYLSFCVVYLIKKKCCHIIAVRTMWTNMTNIIFLLEKILVMNRENHEESVAPRCSKHSAATLW